MIYTCPICGEPCDLRARKDGTVWTEYWGNRKPHDEYTFVTACCGSEEYGKLDIVQAVDRYNYEPSNSRIIYPGEE